MSETVTVEPGREPAQMSVRGAAVWAMGGQYLSFGIQFITSVIISRFFLTPPEVGLFSIGLSAAMIVSMLQDFGLSRYIYALPSVGPEQLARCSTVALLFSFLIAAVIAASAWPMAHFYHQPRLQPIMLIIAGSYLFMPLGVVPMALLARAMAFRSVFAVIVGAALAQGAVGLILAALGFSTMALAWGTLAAGVARGVIAQCIRPALPWPLRLTGTRPIVSAGSRLTTLNAAAALGTRTPDMIVGKLLGLLAVGFYSRAVSLSDQFRTLMSGAIGSVFFPAFARIRDRGEPLGPAYLRVVAGYTAVIWPGMAGLSLAAAPIVHLLYGPRWMGVAPLLTLISLTELFLVSLPLNAEMPILLGKLNRLIAYNSFDTVISIGLLMIGCHWGVTGAAASRIVYGVCWVAIYARFLYVLIGFDMHGLLRIYAKSGIVTLAALAPLSLIYLFWIGPTQISLTMLIPAVGAGVGLWLAAMVLIRHPALDDIIGILAHLPGAQVLTPLFNAVRRSPC